MRKFTVFTFVLTVITVVVVAEYVVNEYLPGLKKDSSEQVVSLDEVPLPTEINIPKDVDLSKTMETNIFGSDLGTEEILLGDENILPDALTETDLSFDTLPLDDSALPSLEEDLLIEDTPIVRKNEPSTAGEFDFEDENFNSFSPSVLIREDHVRSAGFSDAVLENEVYDGYLFKSIFVDDLTGVKINKYAIKTTITMFAKVYAFESDALDSSELVFDALKTKISSGLDVTVNQTDEFGDASFYMNDLRRSNVAFLTVRIGDYVYAFSYPKEYHAQIKNLVTLLNLEF